jgi:hypothetical protein
MDNVTMAIGETVYLKLKTDHCGMVTGILFRPNGVTYYVTWAHDFTERGHYECEITKEKSYVSESA